MNVTSIFYDAYEELALNAFFECEDAVSATSRRRAALSGAKLQTKCATPSARMEGFWNHIFSIALFTMNLNSGGDL